MKLRIVLFFVVVIIMAFDIVLIARHKRLPLRPPLASGAPQDSAESKSTERRWFDNYGQLSADLQLKDGRAVYYWNAKKPIEFVPVCAATDTTAPRSLRIEKIDNRAIYFRGHGSDAVAFLCRPPFSEWEPPAPKPAGERKL
jgi:hypothetical protein